VDYNGTNIGTQDRLKVQMTTLPDYRYDPEAYELEQRSRPDEMLMIERASAWAADWLDRCRSAFVLDLCCGTGISMRHILAHQNVVGVAGVDNCQSYLDFARRTLLNSRIQPALIHADAVTVDLEKLGRRHWDLAILCSAYHHIEDTRKLDFMLRVGDLIGSDGRAVMAENILPTYRKEDPNSYESAVRMFYTEVLRTAREANPGLSNHVAGLIQRVAEYGVDGEYEFKVSMAVLEEDLRKADLIIVKRKRVWPRTEVVLGPQAGNFIFEIKSGNRREK
jgi:SAM-dependent methyltransferase